MYLSPKSHNRLFNVLRIPGNKIKCFDSLPKNVILVTDGNRWRKSVSVCSSGGRAKSTQRNLRRTLFLDLMVRSGSKYQVPPYVCIFMDDFENKFFNT